MEIIKVEDVAEWFKVSKAMVYDMTNPRTRNGDLREDPLPVLRMGAAVRFNRKALEDWLERLEKRGR
jgi:predicted DNA-binding transcriptional regulator AlpA